MPASECTCIGHLERRDDRTTWVVDILDDECPNLSHRAGVA